MANQIDTGQYLLHVLRTFIRTMYNTDVESFQSRVINRFVIVTKNDIESYQFVK